MLFWKLIEGLLPKMLDLTINFSRYIYIYKSTFLVINKPFDSFFYYRRLKRDTLALSKK